MNFLDQIGIRHPIIQAPMAGTSTPQLASAVTNAGGLGSIAVGAIDAAGARKNIQELRTLTSGPFNVNVFAHKPALPDPAREAAWVAAMRPLFESFGATPPPTLKEIYKSFVVDDDMLTALVELAPKVVSFHFGLPPSTAITRLKGAGCLLFSTATNLVEAQAAANAGIDAIVAQGIEAGGHRGVFEPSARDEGLETLALTRLLTDQLEIPIIAAGGMMNGASIRAALSAGAVAAQLGTAFIACPESNADQGYRQAIANAAPHATLMTKVISGRPARCLDNLFTLWGKKQSGAIPDYPIAYDAGKALNTVAKAKGEYGYGAQWAGTGAHLSRIMPAHELMQTLIREFESA